MPRNGSGTYSLPAGNPVVTGTTISSTVQNNTTSDIATALTNSLAKDGQTVPTASLPMGGFRHTGVGNAAARTDYAATGQVQDGSFIYVGTVGGTADVITLTPSPAITAYVAGQTFRFISSGANTTAVTVNVSAVGAKAVTKEGATALVASDIPSGAIVDITYDGTQFQIKQVSVSGVFNNVNSLSEDSAPDVIADFLLEYDTSASVAKKVRPQMLAIAAANIVLVNGTLTASVGSSALTVALKTRAGTDPSATDPVYVMFRNATAATGDYAILTVTAATSVVVSSGSTLGTTSGLPSRVWIVAFNDAGTFRLGVINCCTSTNVFALSSDMIASSTAEGGAGGADSAGVFYTGTAVASKAMRVLGYVESTQATAGTWATTPSKLQLWTPGMKLPGSIVQTVISVDGAVATGTTTTPQDNSIPQITEGDQYITVTITPTSAINRLEHSINVNGGASAGNSIIVALFQDATANALKAINHNLGANNVMNEVGFNHYMVAGTTSATTFRTRIGLVSAGTFTFNGQSSGQIFNGVALSSMRVTEIMA